MAMHHVISVYVTAVSFYCVVGDSSVRKGVSRTLLPALETLLLLLACLVQTQDGFHVVLLYFALVLSCLAVVLAWPAVCSFLKRK